MPVNVVLSGTCTTCSGCEGFTNLAVRCSAESVTFDPHAVGACAVTVKRDEIKRLLETLVLWASDATVG